MRTSFLIISLCLISACSGQPDMAASAIEAGVDFPLQGRSGDVDFSLSDEVFNVERPGISYFLLIALYFPLLLL
jgi:hypothetical protein